MTEFNHVNQSCSPLFVISLPRSGSTLLQRILASHQEVATVAEPWLLLPLSQVIADYNVAAYSSYGCRAARTAIDEMCSHLGRGREELLAILRTAASELYASLRSGDQRYFLDKTPRYYLIIDFLAELFPDAKFVFLLRNPLDVLASIIETWGHGRAWLHHYHQDIYAGPRLIADGLGRYGDRSICVHYECLVNWPDFEMRRICDHLGIEFASETLREFEALDLSGSMGDPSRHKKVGRVTTERIDKWRYVLATTVRKRMAARYIRSMGDSVLSQFGYNADDLIDQIDQLPGSLSKAVEDCAALAASSVARAVVANVVRSEWRNRSPDGIAKLS